MDRMPARKLIPSTAIVLAALLMLWVAIPATGQPQGGGGAASKDAPLPARGVVIDIDSPEKGLYQIAVPDLRGGAAGKEGADVLRNDFKLVSLFKVLDPRSYLANAEKEGMNLDPKAWSSVGAQGVIKGEIRGGSVEMRLYELAKGGQASLTKTYPAGGQLRKSMHLFANEVLKVLTGKAGAFDSRITYAMKMGAERKDVFVADYDGHGAGRVSSGKGIAMLPNFGPGGVWYSRLTKTGMFITRSGMGEKPIVSSSGMDMAPTVCNGRIYFTSTRDGNSEIYSSNLSGGDVRRLTKNRSIDVSPTCGPGGKIAFVSNRQGGPQVFVMDADGGGAKRLTFRGDYNQTPAFCNDPENPMLAFTGRAGGMDVFTINLKTQQYTRITQGQGMNKDPAFSPDCRMIAFASSRGGIFIANPEGLNQNKVVSGAAETVRWSR